MVNEGNDAWIRVFGEEMDANDIVLSDEDEPSTSQFPRSLGTLNSRSNLWIDPATSAWAKEHARMVDEGNDDWIGVYGQEMDADDIQLSDEDEPGTSHSPRSTRKASDLKTTRSVHREITHDLADCVYAPYYDCKIFNNNDMKQIWKKHGGKGFWRKLIIGNSRTSNDFVLGW
jgi:hypothetical protein